MTDATEAARRIVESWHAKVPFDALDEYKQCALTVARALLAIAEPMQDMRERARPTPVEQEILDIMRDYDEQWPNIDTPGGFEHLGDVWKTMQKWRKAIAAAIEGGKP